MAFTDSQTKALKAKLRHQYVKTRETNDAKLSYVEGWHAIAEANRIFGFDSWDRQTLSPHFHWANLQHGETECFYSTKVRITVRAGGTVTIREGVGTGLGRSAQAEVAHDLALKAAETDATKRALATFGNPFGLALYDREQSQVTKPRRRSQTERTASEQAVAPLVLELEDGRKVEFDAQNFVVAILKEVEKLGSVAAIYAFWSTNLAALTELRRRTDGAEIDPADRIRRPERTSALPHLRTTSSRWPPSAVRSTASHEPEGVRRIYPSTLQYPPRCRPQDL
jgi:DNA recombination protein Rad52